MTNTMSKLVVLGAFCAKVGPSRSVVRMVPFSVRARASGLVRVPCKTGFTTAWVPAEVVKAQQKAKVEAERRREHLAHYGAVEAELKAMFQAQGIRLGRAWADIEMPPLPAEDPVCVPLPAGRMTPPQFREWLAAGWARCLSEREARRWVAYATTIRNDYFANLPDCVFAAAVRKERDEAELRAYRAGKAACEAQAQLREEIRVKSALRVDYQRQPQFYFGTRAEQLDAMKTLGREVKALQRKLAPTALVEVKLDGSLWPEQLGGWASVVATGRVAKPVAVEITAEAKAEQERIARWKKMQTTETTSASRAAWRHHKELVQQGPKTEEESTGCDFWREQNY